MGTLQNAFVKQFLVSLHGGFIWLDQNFSIDFDLIMTIMGLPLVVVDPTPFFDRKEQDNLFMGKLKEKYELIIGTRGFSIISINDDTFWFVDKYLSRKLMFKM